MVRWLTFALLLLIGPAGAQTYTNQAAIVGAGAGVVGFNVVGPCNGQVLGWSGGIAQCITTSGTGTVQSVGLALPASTFSISGSPVVNSGTLTGSFINQTANTFFAGPGSGGAATPGWRVLVNADIPVPTTSALGGIKALSPVSHSWINQIDNSGTPQVTQPAFTDISGTLASSQCPQPTVGAIGCVQAINQITSNWINSISVAGVPQLSQPNFSDLAGTIGVPQYGTFIANSLIANATGSSAIPTNISLTGFIDAAFGSARGDILFRGASGWTVLAPDSAGKVLSTNGGSADPSWISASGVGTVTSVTCNGGLSGGTFSSSGTCALSPVADGSVLANISGGNAAPSANTLTAIIDHDITSGSTQGNILYRSGSVWAALGPDTAGKVLQTNGAGANPSWVSLNSAVQPQGRITLTANTPVMTAAATAQSTLRYDCYRGNLVSVYNGSNDITLTIGGCELTDVMQSSSTGVINNAGVFDVWAINVSATLTLCVATNGSGGGWASDTGGSNTTRGTGYSQLDFTTRPYVTNKNAITHCYNGATDRGTVSANQATYLGTFFSTAAGQTSWTPGVSGAAPTAGCLCVWNAYNQAPVSISLSDTRSSWTYNSTTPREADGANNSGSFRIQFVSGTSDQSITATYQDYTAASAGGGSTIIGVCLDATNSFSGNIGGGVNTASGQSSQSGGNTSNTVGFHFYSACEASASGTVSFFGSSAFAGSPNYDVLKYTGVY